MNDLYLLAVGLLLVVGTGLGLLFKLYRISTTQGFVSESQPVFAVLFGMLNWRGTWGYLVIFVFGILLCSIAIFL